MINPLEIVSEPQSKEIDPTLKTAITQACHRIPPLWPLKDFVAVNPFLGLSDQHFLSAAALLQRTAHGEILKPKSYYQERWAKGEINDFDLQETLELLRQTLPVPWREQARAFDKNRLQQEINQSDEQAPQNQIQTVADLLTTNQNEQWATFVTEEISKWCSVYFDEGQSSWRMPWRGDRFYAAWREVAKHDANPRLSGLKNFNHVVRELPQDPEETIQLVLKILKIPTGLQQNFLHRQLMSIAGWSSYVQYQVRLDLMPGAGNQGLTELLAIRLAYDLVLWKQFQKIPTFAETWQKIITTEQTSSYSSDLLTRYILQSALEKNYQRGLVSRLRTAYESPPAHPQRPLVQAVFCIDVRSEIYRRHLEIQNKRIITSGFAGFFGMFIEHIPLGETQGVPQCPVLFAPKYKVREALRNNAAGAETSYLQTQLLFKRLAHCWNSFKTSAVSCFSFVETSGLWFGWKLIHSTLATNKIESPLKAAKTGPEIRTRVELGQSQTTSIHNGCGIPFGDQVDVAEGTLRNLGLINHFPHIVLFCGHGSSTTNNPYAAGLDCGACGGHAGQVNAQVAAAIFNSIHVREGLKKRNIVIPEDTLFLAGLHNTTTDDVSVFDLMDAPDSHAEDLQKIIQWLKLASRQTRQERSVRLGEEATGAQLEENIRNRSADWSQVRPEWGLANNAAFIAAPRARTKSFNLEGRTFLHDYQASKDPEGKVLELILMAPVVVASWINLQYYASTVNNRLYGSGNKTLHNVVGAMGIWQGNGGDLQTGLPLQSLHDGNKWMHESLRLSVYVESERATINRVLVAHPEVKELVQNGWFFLFALGSTTEDVWQYTTDLQWQLVSPAANELERTHS